MNGRISVNTFCHSDKTASRIIEREKVLEIWFFGSRSKIYILFVWQSPIFWFWPKILVRAPRTPKYQKVQKKWPNRLSEILSGIWMKNWKIGAYQPKSIYILDLEPKNQFSSTFFSFTFLGPSFFHWGRRHWNLISMPFWGAGGSMVNFVYIYK